MGRDILANSRLVEFLTLNLSPAGKQQFYQIGGLLDLVLRLFDGKQFISRDVIFPAHLNPSSSSKMNSRDDSAGASELLSSSFNASQVTGTIPATPAMIVSFLPALII